MTIAPFSLIERDQRGAIKRVVPLQYVGWRNMPTLNNKALAERGR